MPLSWYAAFTKETAGPSMCPVAWRTRGVASLLTGGTCLPLQKQITARGKARLTVLFRDIGDDCGWTCSR